MNKLLGVQVAYWPKAEWALLDTVEPLAGLIASVDDADKDAVRVNISFLNSHGSSHSAQHVPFYAAGDRPKGQPYCEDFGTVGKFTAADKKEAKVVADEHGVDETPPPIVNATK